MTDTEINIAIAECCGWRGPSAPYHLVDAQMAQPLDYVNDLNAMHEAEKSLTTQQEQGYVERLGATLMNAAYDNDPRWLDSELSSHDSVYRATARQRAEAFLRTVGKWKEDK